MLNPAGKECTANFELNISYSNLKLLAGKEIKVAKDQKKITVTMPGQTYAIYKLL